LGCLCCPQQFNALSLHSGTRNSCFVRLIRLCCPSFPIFLAVRRGRPNGAAKCTLERTLLTLNISSVCFVIGPLFCRDSNCCDPSLPASFGLPFMLASFSVLLRLHCRTHSYFRKKNVNFLLQQPRKQSQGGLMMLGGGSSGQRPASGSVMLLPSKIMPPNVPQPERSIAAEHLVSPAP
jgi:hypothetical protein